jgi:hypothetical protein
MRRRHANVDKDQSGLVVADELDEIRTVARLSGHLEARTFEQARQPFTEKEVVLGNNDSCSGHASLSTGSSVDTVQWITMSALPATG